MLDRGAVVDSGTHEQLIERCELYRELISGPDDQAEGQHTNRGSTRSSAEAWGRRDSGGDFDGVRFELVANAEPRLQAGGMGGGGMGGGGGGRRMRAGAAGPPTPELMAAIKSLPPVRDWPHEDLAQQTAPVAGKFNFWRYLRPLYLQLALGAMFIVLDSACLLAGPQFVRYTINNAIQQHDGQLLLVLIGLYFACQPGRLVLPVAGDLPDRPRR